MALIERDLAADIVGPLREQEHLGTGFTPIADVIAAKQHHLEREQWWRAQMGRMADLVEAAGVADRTVRGGV